MQKKASCIIRALLLFLLVWFIGTVILCVFTDVCKAADAWTTEDTVRELVYVSITNKDRRQTLECLDNKSCREGNPVIGPYPSKDRLNGLVLLSVIGHAWIAAELNQPYRKYWQYSWIGIESFIVYHNDKERKMRLVTVQFVAK